MAATDNFRAYLQQYAPQYLGYVGAGPTGNVTDSYGINRPALQNAVGSNFNNVTQDINKYYTAYWNARSGSGSTGGSTGGSGGGGYGYTSGVNDPSTLAQYDIGIQNLQGALGNLEGQRTSGYSEVNAKLQDALTTLLNARTQAENTYNTNKKTTQDDFIVAKNTVGSQAGNLLNGLQRLLGSRGAGGSSASRILAPGLVARDASMKRSEVGNTFAKNNQGLDTSWGNYGIQYEGQRKSASSQAEQQRAAVDRAVSERQQDILSQLALLRGQSAAARGGNAVNAAAPYLAQARAAGSRAANYTVSPVNVATPAYQAPDLAKYLVNPTTPTYQGQTQTNDYTSPYLAALLGPQKKQQTAGV